MNTEDKKEIPAITVKDGVLTITISASDLKWLAENDPKNSYIILDPEMFLNHFAANLEEYQTTNAQENGTSALQEFIDTIIDETYSNGSEAIINRDED